jgi:hypothetical protein
MADTLSDALHSSPMDYVNVDLTTRRINISPNFCIGVYNDKRTTTMRFETDLYHDGETLQYYDIHVHYRNNNNPVHSVSIEDREIINDKLRFTWLVDNNAYFEAGTVSFIISFTRGGSSEDDPAFELNTTVATVVVLPGLEVNPFDVDPALEVAARDILDRVQQMSDQVQTESEDIRYMYENLNTIRDGISSIADNVQRAEAAADAAMDATPSGYTEFVDSVGSLNLSNVDGTLNVTFVKS